MSQTGKNKSETSLSSSIIAIHPEASGKKILGAAQYKIITTRHTKKAQRTQSFTK